MCSFRLHQGIFFVSKMSLKEIKNTPFFHLTFCWTNHIQGPGVARAVLQTPPHLKQFREYLATFQILSILNRKSQGAEILRECFTCHMSYVTCHISYVICQVSHVRCHVSAIICQVSSVIFFLQSVGASWWRVCYQQGIH